MAPPKKQVDREQAQRRTMRVRRSRRISERDIAARDKGTAALGARLNARRKIAIAKNEKEKAKQRSHRIVLEDPEPNPVKRIPKIAKHLVDKFGIHDIDFRFHTGGFWIGRLDYVHWPWRDFWPYTITAAQIERSWDELKDKEWLPKPEEIAEMEQKKSVTEKDVLQWEYVCDFTLRVKSILEKHGIPISDESSKYGFEVLYHEDDDDVQDDDTSSSSDEDGLKEYARAAPNCGLLDTCRPSSYTAFIVPRHSNAILGPSFYIEEKGPRWGPYIIEAPNSGPEEAAKKFEADLEKSIDKAGKQAIVNWTDANWLREFHDLGWV